MKKILNILMKISCSTVGIVLLSMATLATNSMSSLNTYEHKMPAKLLPKDD